MNPRIKSKPCVKCGFPVNRSGSRTAAHYTETPCVGGMRKVRCDGSDMPYAAHGIPLEATITEVKPSAFHRVLARLRGHSVTWVDFREAHEQRELGHVTERAHAVRFIKCEVRSE